jgi:glutathione peroxidase
MSKLFLLLIAIAVLAIIYSFYLKAGKPTSSIHQFKSKSIDGELIDFALFKGKKILIVNTASKCGFTPQFKALEELFITYKDKNFVVVGFPCNQFGSQDPGTGVEIKEFCTRNYGVTFLMMEKINVKGDSISEIYKWLTSKKENGVMSSSVKWNFQKYMIDENGFLVDYVFSFKSPTCSKIVSWIEKKD